MSEPLLGTASAANAIERVKYSHDAMIDLMIAQPMISQGELAAHFGYTQTWVSRVINSDAFQARLALRKEEIIDPVIVASMEEKMKAVAAKSLDIVLEKLNTIGNFDNALKAFEATSKAMGYGARQPQAVQNNFVIALPAKAASAEEWMRDHSKVVGNGQ